MCDAARTLSTCVKLSILRSGFQAASRRLFITARYSRGLAVLHHQMLVFRIVPLDEIRAIHADWYRCEQRLDAVGSASGPTSLLGRCRRPRPAPPTSAECS